MIDLEMLLRGPGTVMLKSVFSSPLPQPWEAATVNSFSTKPRRHPDSEQPAIA